MYPTAVTASMHPLYCRSVRRRQSARALRSLCTANADSQLLTTRGELPVALSIFKNVVFHSADELFQPDIEISRANSALYVTMRPTRPARPKEGECCSQKKQFLRNELISGPPSQKNLRWYEVIAVCLH